jgi:hypothetical protein
MGNDEYASAVGGGLKLKGGPLAGIKKKKKKSSKEKEKLSTNLERALSPSKPSPASGAASTCKAAHRRRTNCRLGGKDSESGTGGGGRRRLQDACGEAARGDAEEEAGGTVEAGGWPKDA